VAEAALVVDALARLRRRSCIPAPGSASVITEGFHRVAPKALRVGLLGQLVESEPYGALHGRAGLGSPTGYLTERTVSARRAALVS
jgi:hypothetical protein